MGALTYEPDMHHEIKTELPDLDRISDACRQVQEQPDSAPSGLEDLFALGGS